MLVIWDYAAGNPPSLFFKPENESDDATLQMLFSAWECFSKHRKDKYVKDSQAKAAANS